MFTMLSVMAKNINIAAHPLSGKLCFEKTSGHRIINKLHKWATGRWGAPQWEIKTKRWCNVGPTETAGAGGGEGTPSQDASKENTPKKEAATHSRDQKTDQTRPTLTKEARRGKKSAISVERGDARWQSNMALWGNEEHTIRTLAEINVIGSDLWYKQPPDVT